MIIEKAYAKLYKSFNNIEGGKVHIALAELTGGIPQYIKITDTIQDNIEEFWEKLYQYFDNRYMLGAGTPENERGDSAVSPEGIVKGHAYAILNMVMYGSDKLIQLRNPHGCRGIEWTGDWSDESPMWTPAAIEELNVQSKSDGIFWMSIENFAEEFKYVYICRQFDNRWTMVTIEDSCSTTCNLKEDGFECYPQYIIKITKPTTVFLKMTQSQRRSTFQGEFPIFVVLLSRYGKLAYKKDTTNMLTSSLPPINYSSVTAEFFSDRMYGYPLKITVVAGMNNSTSKFTVNFYSTDINMTVQKIN